MKRSLRILTPLTALLVGSLAHATEKPNLNAYATAPRAASLGSPLARATTEAGFGTVASRDEKRDVPTFFWAPPGGPRPPQSWPATPEAWARFYIEHYAPMYGLSKEALATAGVVMTHNLGRGGIVVTLRQRINDIEVHRNDVKVLMRQDGELVAITGNLHPSASASMKRGNTFKVTPAQAVAGAFGDLYDITASSVAINDARQTKGAYSYFNLGFTPAVYTAKLHFVDPARAKKVFFPLPDRLVGAYYVEIFAGKMDATSSDSYAYVIAADDGRVLYRENLTHAAAFTYRVWTDASALHRPSDGPMADYTPHPTGIPDGSAPPFVMPGLVTVDGFNTNPANTFDPWLPAGATVTTGNNVDAYADLKNTNGGANIVRPTITMPGTFDRTYNTALAPTSSQTQEMAAVTQLFYNVNWQHDWWYDSGFNEAAGVAQTNNFGRGGMAGDPLLAEGQDGATLNPPNINNANMATPADGQSPRMQMYMWSGVDVKSLIVQPGNLSFGTNSASFGPQVFNVPASPLLLVNDGVVGAPMGMPPVPGTVTDGCEPITTNLNGAIALIDRGYCNYTVKVLNAQQKGAVGVIIVNNVPGGAAPMGGMAGGIMIPALSISLADGNTLKTMLMAPPVTAAMSRSAAGANRDGTIDGGIIGHEWGHYLHHRLTSCGSPQCNAESEGWADFNALHQVVRPGDNLDGVWATGIYAAATFGDSAYFGIRRYPYSTDMTKNPLTFKHITTGVPLPVGPPMLPASPDNAEVHNAGEIWCEMMAESYLALQKDAAATARYTFDGARRVMSDYVVAGMKVMPVDPTYTETRDGVLAAAYAGEPLDFALFAQAFAKRGAGACAVSPARDSVDFSGVVEDFVVSPNMALVSVEVDDSVSSCDMDGVLDAGETGKVKVTLRNTGFGPLTGAQATVTSVTPSITFPNGATAVFGSIAPFSTGVGTVDIAMNAGIATKIDVSLNVAVTAPTGCTLNATAPSVRQLNYDNVPVSVATDSFESDIVTWTSLNATGPSNIWTRQRPLTTASNHTWYAPDVSGVHDERLESPPITVGAGNLTLTFQHRFKFESDPMANWDGGVIEVSVAGGPWQDISMYGNPGYGGVIGDPVASNPLLGRQGYVKQNAGYPAMVPVTINMGAMLANQTIKIRFRMGTDEAVGDFGWEVDNVGVVGAGTPFSGVVDNMCVLATTSSSSGMATSSSTSGSSTSSSSGMATSSSSGMATSSSSGMATSSSSGMGGAMASSSTSGMGGAMASSSTSGMGGATVTSSSSSSKASSSAAGHGGVADGSGGAGGGGGLGNDGGCGCTTVGETSDGSLSPLLAAALLLLRRRRNSRNA